MSAPRLLIVADDLTGALDCACEAAALGIGTAVFPEPDALAGAEDLPSVVAVSTCSRDGTAASAIRQIERIVALLPEIAPERMMKKVDSRLKGHPGAETATLARAMGLTRVLAVPAIPDMGRIQRGGWLSGTGIFEPLEIGALFPGLDVLTPDIDTPADFGPALAVSDALPVGARGLAGALVRSLWPKARPRLAPPLPGPALVVVGSRDPITLAQVDRLRACRRVDWRGAPNGRLADRTALRAGLGVVQLISGAVAAEPTQAVAELASGVLDLLGAGRVATVIATGGATAQALMAALGADRIAVTSMPLPGIAQGLVVVSPSLAPLHLVTKSGGFGRADTLLDLTGKMIAAEIEDGTPT